MSNPLGWSPKKTNYEQQAMYSRYSHQDGGDNSNKNEYKPKTKFNVVESTLKLKTDQLSDTASQTSSEFDQFGAPDMLHRKLAENHRKHREIETEEFEKTSKKIQDLRETRFEYTDVSSIDYAIASRKFHHMNKELGEIDKRIRGLG